MILSYIVAMDRNRAIGHNNQLPWHLPADLKFFKKTTLGHTILMGRKTYESIGKPLPGRTNVVMTQNRDYMVEGCEIVHTVEEVKTRYANVDELFMIGGAELFKLFMDDADKLYITRIDHEFEADTYFPELDASKWRKVSSEQGVKDEKNPYDYFFEVYERVHA
ncbi:dihydrofolate reductase [Paenibacillus sp. N1-5-1-14]|uniref:dihydrofolate reductase n=1 Tax=Paenibacillus radicibacter TaxID=2972488 RepID=UPI0021599869|nr:dihydrofolate reductase [Paenibacillus radicibacter]MCR8644942.1 dihydrofolate reductase [Paenibacillus radicibacter]